MTYKNKLIGKRMKEARNDLELTVRDVGDMIGVSGATISRYENGEVNKIKLPVLSQISKVLQVNEEWLLGISEIKDASIDKIRSSQYPFIPNLVATGLPAIIDGYSNLPSIDIPNAILGKYANRKDIIIMRVNDEFMTDIFPINSLIGVIVSTKLTDLKDNDLVIFKYKGQYNLKRYYIVDNRIVFKSESNNPYYTDIVIENNSNLDIVGKVIMYSTLV